MKNLTVHGMIIDRLYERCSHEYLHVCEWLQEDNCSVYNTSPVFSDDRSTLNIFSDTEKQRLQIEIDVEEDSFHISIIGSPIVELNFCPKHHHDSRHNYHFDSTSIDFDPEKMIDIIINIVKSTIQYINELDEIDAHLNNK